MLTNLVLAYSWDILHITLVGSTLPAAAIDEFFFYKILYGTAKDIYSVFCFGISLFIFWPYQRRMTWLRYYCLYLYKKKSGLIDLPCYWEFCTRNVNAWDQLRNEWALRRDERGRQLAIYWIRSNIIWDQPYLRDTPCSDHIWCTDAFNLYIFGIYFPCDTVDHLVPYYFLLIIVLCWCLMTSTYLPNIYFLAPTMQ